MPKIQFNMRIEQDLKMGLEESAKSQNRTASNLVEWLIKQYLEQLTNRGAPSPDAFDTKIAADAEAGKLDFLLDAAQREYDAGKLHFQ
jgi:hypothetical protein